MYGRARLRLLAVVFCHSGRARIYVEGVKMERLHWFVVKDAFLTIMRKVLVAGSAHAFQCDASRGLALRSRQHLSPRPDLGLAARWRTNFDSCAQLTESSLICDVFVCRSPKDSVDSFFVPGVRAKSNGFLNFAIAEYAMLRSCLSGCGRLSFS